MKIITEIIRTVLGVTGIAIYPIEKEIVLEFDMRIVCHFNKDVLHNSFVNRSPLVPDSTGDNRNILINDITDYLSWNLDPTTGKITAVKKNLIDIIDLNGNIIEKIPISPPFEVDNVYPDDRYISFLYIYSRPVNVDFYECGAGIYNKNDKIYYTSEKIHSSDLAITAIWNSSLEGWLIHDTYNQKLYLWNRGSKEVIELKPPIKKKDINYSFNEMGTFVTATEEDDDGTIISWWMGNILNGKMLWQKPKSVVSGLTDVIIVNPDGTKAAGTRSIGLSKTLCVLEVGSGEIIDEVPIEEDYVNIGLGWISNTEIVSAGSNGIFLLSLKMPSVSWPNFNIKTK